MSSTLRLSLRLRPEGSERSARESNGGAEGNRTLDLLNAIQALSQLSYGPTLYPKMLERS